MLLSPFICDEKSLTTFFLSQMYADEQCARAKDLMALPMGVRKFFGHAKAKRGSL
jgi:hypothetical protein